MPHVVLQSKSFTWHRKCYQDTVHPRLCKTAKERYENHLTKMGVVPNSDISSSEKSIFTRSQSSPYDTNCCSFCERAGLYQNPLHKVATENAGVFFKF